jgi:hypothetical protein
MDLLLAALLVTFQDPVDVEGQPLAANVERLQQALEFLGAPLPSEVQSALKDAGHDARKIQEILDKRALVIMNINPESRVKVARGAGTAVLQQGGYTPILVKVVNDSPVKATPRITSPQSGPRMTGGSGNPKGDPSRFLLVEMFQKPPMTDSLSGLKVEYLLALIYSTESGKREATLGFDVGQGTQDLGFRGEAAVLFDVRPGIEVKLSITDFDGKPTSGRFTFLDKLNHVFPPQPKRLAPDFFFHKQIYRHDGGTVLLPPGELTMTYGRGPEYKLVTKKVAITDKGDAAIAVKLDRWVNPMDYGFFSGDHHIHAAGCAHYTNPTEGVHAPDMFLHVKGEGLNVGCNLTWGPCYDYQRQFFEPGAHKLSEPFTVLKYDVEVSGFGSQALGHVCLLNLKDQTYPGSEGTKTKGWPTWTTPLMKWAKAQGAYTGYAHSANGLAVNDVAATRRIQAALAGDKSLLVLPEEFAVIDTNGDKELSEQEIQLSVNRSKQKLPNLVVPEMNGIGAQEICVTSAQGICDFISAMDTNRLQEWNCWYHIMNCGFPLKASGETDFPCVSGGRVGEGRVYVQLGKIDRIDYAQWCEGVGKGRSYVSDGYAHALQFTVNGKPAGADVALGAPGKVEVKTRVAFASEPLLGTAPGGFLTKDPKRLVEIIVNGQVAATREVPADDREHDLSFDVAIDRSSWIAVRHFPQMHTNPVNVIVAGKPIRASRKSALWCIGVIEQLWRVRGQGIAAPERDEAKKTFDWAIERYKKIAAESPEGS